MQHNKFQASLSQVVLKKIFEYCSMYFYGLNLGPPCLGLHLKKLGKGPLGNATYQISSI